MGSVPDVQSMVDVTGPCSGTDAMTRCTYRLYQQLSPERRKTVRTLSKLIRLEHSLAVEDDVKQGKRTPLETEAHVENLRMAVKLKMTLKLTAPLDRELYTWGTHPETASRYLEGYDWKLMDALRYLLNTLEWRREYKPLKITSTIVRTCIGELPFIYHNGFDRQGAPIVYVRPRNIPESCPPESIMSAIVYTLERVIVKMPSEAEGYIVFLVDSESINTSIESSLSSIKGLVDIFTRHYVERLKTVIMIGHNQWVSQAVCTLVKPFLQQKTANKIVVLDNECQEEMKILKSKINPLEMEDWIEGGKIPSMSNALSRAYWNDNQVIMATKDQCEVATTVDFSLNESDKPQ